MGFENNSLGKEYSIILNRFEKKIKKDRKYFTYRNVSDEELIDIINQRGLDLLDTALEYINPLISPNHGINFNNRDDDLQMFDFDLYRPDVDLISEGMIVAYMDEEKIKLNTMEKDLGNDIKTYCPADERNSFMNMLETERNELDKKIDNYNMRDRITNKLLSAY